MSTHDDKNIKNIEIKHDLTHQPKDIKMEVLLNLKYPDMLVFCQSDESFNNICKENNLWNKMIERDFPFYPSDEHKAKESYEYWYKFFDQFVLRIISTYVVYRTKYTNLQTVYEGIFKLLVNYIEKNNIMMEMETTMLKRDEYIDEVEMNMFLEIFKILGVPITFDKSFIHLIPRTLIENTDKSKWANLKQIFYDMMMTYDDPPHVLEDALKETEEYKSIEQSIDELPIDEPTLPEDVMLEILYEADFETIKNYCLTKKDQNICHSKEFWKFIFKRDNVPIKDSSLDWIKDYEQYQSYVKESKLLLRLPYEYTFGIYDVILNPDQPEYFNNYIVQKYGKIFNNERFFYTNLVKNDYKIIFGEFTNNIIIDINTFTNLMADLLYFNPNITIHNSQHVPLREKDVKQCVNTRGLKTICKKILTFYNQNK